MSNKTTLNGMCPGAAGAALGDRIDATITLVNELRAAWSGDYTQDSDTLTWAGAVKDLLNEIKADFNALRADVAVLRSAYEAHRVDETAHAAADSTNAAPALTSTDVTKANIDSLSSNAIDLPEIEAPAVDPLDPEEE